MTKEERKRRNRMAELGCALCRHLGLGETPASIHHRRTGTGLMRAGDDQAMPLCHHHHQGKEGLHTLGRKAWEVHFGVTELELLAATNALLD